MGMHAWLADLIQDVRYTSRTLLRSPGFTVVAVLTLALGVGANTAMFSVLYSTCLAPLRYVDPGSLVDVSLAQRSGDKLTAGASPANLRDWMAEAHSFQGLAAHRAQMFVSLTGHTEAKEVQAWRLSARLLSMLGVRPLLGRWFVPDEDNANGPRSALLSYQLWMHRFGGDSNVLGNRVYIDGEVFTIVGVMPDGYEFPPLMGEFKPVIWLSLNVPADMNRQRGSHSLHVVGRLKPTVTLKQAQAEMEAIAGRLARAYPKENSQWLTAKVSPISDPHFVRELRSTLWLLLTAASFVLAIACANIASLLIARNAKRSNEFDIRRALGVSVGRLVRQVLTESCVIAGAGCASGVLLAFSLLPVLKSMLEGRPRADEISISLAVLAFASGISFISGILFGILPAVREALADARGGRSSYGRTPRQPLRKALVSVEIALGLVLLSAAGVLVESLWRAMHVDLGFSADRVLSLRLTLPQNRYETGRRVEVFREELLRQISAVPSVEYAGTNSAIPMGIISQSTDFAIEGKPNALGEDRSVSFANVSPDYLRAMRIPILRGRNFRATDQPGSPPVVIVSESVARKFFAGDEVLNKHIRLERLSTAAWFTVVGVAGDVRESRPETAPDGTIYALSSQLPASEQGGATGRLIVLVVRTAGKPSAITGAVRARVAAIDKDQPIEDVLTMRQLVDRKLAARRLNTVVLGMFAGIAVLLVTVGVFGLVSYAVSFRTNEIGIRMALGARRSTILGMIMRETLAFGVPGLTAGVLASVATSRVLASLLYAVAPAAPHILVSSAALVATAMTLSTAFAARRAIGLEPMAALRHE